MLRRAPLLLLSIALAGAALLWFLDGGPGPGSVPAVDPPIQEGDLDPGLPAAAALTEEDGRALRTAAGAAGIVVAPDFPEADADLDLHGVVVREDDTPVAGAEIEIWAMPARSFNGLDIAHSRQREVVATLRSDRLGRFVARVERDQPHDVQARAAGLAVPVARTCFAGEFLRLVATPAGSLRGRLTLASDGAPVPGVPVRWFLLGSSGTGARTVSDAEGRYAFDALAPGEVEVEVEPPLLRPPPWTEAVIRAGETTELDFALEAGKTLSGRVTDAVTGAPVAGAELTDSWVFQRNFRSDADGRFLLTGLTADPDWGFELHVRADGYGGWNRQLEAFEGLEHSLDVQLRPEHRLRGRVVDGAGRPLAGAYVAAVTSVHREEQKTDWLSGRSGADGRFDLGRLRPELPHAVLLRKPGYGTRIYELPPGEQGSPVIELPDLHLLPAATLRGQLVDLGGAPVPGVELTVEGWNADRDRFNPQRIQDLRHYTDVRNCRSDHRGRFALTELAAGRYRVLAELPDQRQPLLLGAVELADGERREGLRYAVDFGLLLRGKVVDETGAPLARVWVSLETAGRGTRDSTRTGEDGGFRFSGLTAERYTLVAGRYSWGREELESLAVVARAGIEAGGPEVVLSLPRAAVISGVLLRPDGQPAAGESLWLELEAGVRIAAGADAFGAFAFRVPPGELYDLHQSGQGAFPAGPDGAGRPPQPPLLAQVPSGTTGLSLVLHLP